jgi:hypothetical protein
MRMRLILPILVLVLGVIVSSCKPKPPPPKSDEELQLEKLVNTWVLEPGNNSVTRDGGSDVSNWQGFILTLGNKTYQSTSSSAPEVWPASGSWEFGSTVNILVRDAAIDMEVAVVENTSLELKFTIPPTGGRLAGIEGLWVFKMVPQ